MFGSVVFLVVWFVCFELWVLDLLKGWYNIAILSVLDLELLRDCLDMGFDLGCGCCFRVRRLCRFYVCVVDGGSYMLPSG